MRQEMAKRNEGRIEAGNRNTVTEEVKEVQLKNEAGERIGKVTERIRAKEEIQNRI